MTTKEIAEFLEVSERTITRYISELLADNETIRVKNAASSPIHPADYNFLETLKIIRCRLKKYGSDESILFVLQSKGFFLTDRILKNEKELVNKIEHILFYVRRLAESKNIETSKVFELLFDILEYKERFNYRAAAKNKKCSPLEYLFHIGEMQALLEVCEYLLK